MMLASWTWPAHAGCGVLHQASATAIGGNTFAKNRPRFLVIGKSLQIWSLGLGPWALVRSWSVVLGPSLVLRPSSRSFVGSFVRRRQESGTGRRTKNGPRT